LYGEFLFSLTGRWVLHGNKFRVNKREDARTLRVDEKDIEQVNRELSSSVSDLKLQVYDLKTKLLQHTDCDCQLIQEYIANEANRHIHDLGAGRSHNRRLILLKTAVQFSRCS
jgi:hypothetical protein